MPWQRSCYCSDAAFLQFLLAPLQSLSAPLQASLQRCFVFLQPCYPFAQWGRGRILVQRRSRAHLCGFLHCSTRCCCLGHDNGHASRLRCPVARQQQEFASLHRSSHVCDAFCSREISPRILASASCNPPIPKCILAAANRDSHIHKCIIAIASNMSKIVHVRAKNQLHDFRCKVTKKSDISKFFNTYFS